MPVSLCSRTVIFHLPGTCIVKQISVLWKKTHQIRWHFGSWINNYCTWINKDICFTIPFWKIQYYCHNYPYFLKFIFIFLPSNVNKQLWFQNYMWTFRHACWQYQWSWLAHREPLLNAGWQTFFCISTDVYQSYLLNKVHWDKGQYMITKWRFW